MATLEVASHLVVAVPTVKCNRCLALCRGLPLDERQSAAELEAVLHHQHNLQEKLADDMLNLARNLKNNTLAAQNIIKQDNQVRSFRRC